tara:strand:- start:2031 stop:2663 length:633 start_codon:yes stop_codon:yes gene_type:complete
MSFEVEKKIEICFNSYLGKSFEEISSLFEKEYKPTDKGRFRNLTNKIIENCIGEKGIPEKLFLRTCTVKKSGRVAQPLSFPHFEYIKIINEAWEDSELHKILKGKKFLFVFWREVGNGWVLEKTCFWNMPADDLLEAKEVWENTVMLIKNKKADSLPSMAQSRVLHVRPHGSNKADTLPTHYGTKETKKSFWLSASYVTDSVYVSCGEGK